MLRDALVCHQTVEPVRTHTLWPRPVFPWFRNCGGIRLVRQFYRFAHATSIGIASVDTCIVRCVANYDFPNILHASHYGSEPRIKDNQRVMLHMFLSFRN